MRFEEVREMEESPMDEDVLEELCFPYSAASMISDVYAVLILRYYQKYDERYGTHLTRGMEIPQIVPGRDTGYEEESIWLEEIPGVMDRAIYSSGWNIAWISTETEGLQEALEGQKNEDEEKKDFHHAYGSCMEEIFLDGFEKSCFLREEENAMDAAKCLEDGQMGIMWNEQLDAYMRCRAAKRDVIAVVCPEEDKCIARLSEEIWEPYMITYMQDVVTYEGGEYDGRRYCRIVLGFDGYNYCWYDSINPNWICRAVKLNRMLDLALEKIERYEVCE
nr:hypothetical protein [uncultured Acetatifactor sp.]